MTYEYDYNPSGTVKAARMRERRELQYAARYEYDAKNLLIREESTTAGGQVVFSRTITRDRDGRIQSSRVETPDVIYDERVADSEDRVRYEDKYSDGVLDRRDMLVQDGPGVWRLSSRKYFHCPSAAGNSSPE